MDLFSRRIFALGIAFFLIFGTASLCSAAVSQEDMVVIQKVHSAVEEAVRDVPGIEIIMQGSHVTQNNFKNPLTGGSSDFDMRVVIKDNLGTDAAYLDRWRAVRDKLRSGLSRQFPDAKQLDLIEKSVNLYLPEQVMLGVSDRAEAMALYRRLNVVPGLAYEAAEGLDDETLKKAAGGLYGDATAQASRQAFERKYGVTIGKDPKTGQVRRFSSTDLSHLTEGQGVYTPRSAGNAAGQWIDDALTALKNGDAKGLAKNTARAKILLKGKDLLRISLQSNDETLKAAAEEFESILASYGEKVMDEAGTAAFKGEIQAVSTKYSLESVLRTARIDAEALKFAQSGKFAESAVAKGLLTKAGKWVSLSSDLREVSFNSTKGLLPVFLSGVFVTFEGAMLGQVAADDGYDKAMKTLGIDVLGVYSGPIGWAQLGTQITVTILELAVDSVKDKVYKFAAGSQSCSDLIAGVYTVKGREVQGPSDTKCPEVKSYTDLVCLTDKRETVISLFECHAANAVKRFDKGGAGEQETVAGLTGALRKICINDGGQDKNILLEWEAARESLRARVLELVGDIEVMPLGLETSPGSPLALKAGEKASIRTTAALPADLSTKLAELKDRLQCLGAKGSTPGVYVRYKWYLNGAAVSDSSAPAAEIIIDKAGYHNLGLVMEIEYGSSNYEAIKGYSKLIRKEVGLPFQVTLQGVTPPKEEPPKQEPPKQEPPKQNSDGTGTVRPTATGVTPPSTLGASTPTTTSTQGNATTSSLGAVTSATRSCPVGFSVDKLSEKEKQELYRCICYDAFSEQNPGKEIVIEDSIPKVEVEPGWVGGISGGVRDQYYRQDYYFNPSDNRCYSEYVPKNKQGKSVRSRPPIAKNMTECMLNACGASTPPQPAGNAPPTQVTAPSELEKVTVLLEKLEPAETRVPIGSKVRYRATVQTPSKDAAGEIVIRWQPNPEISFEPFETTGTSSSTTATFNRTGEFKIWAVALLNNKGVMKTVGESNPSFLQVIAPEASLQFSVTQPLVGTEVKASIVLPPGIDPKNIDVRWNLGKAELIAESQDSRESTFYLKDITPTEIRANVRVKGTGETLGPEKIATITAKYYDVKITEPKAMGAKPRVYDPVKKDFVDVENGFAVFQDIEVGVQVTPATDKGPLRYEWASAESNCSISAPASAQTRINCQRTGSYPIGVSVKDSRGIELGRAMTNLPITIGQENMSPPPTVKIQAAKSSLKSGERTTISATASGGKPGYTYIWSGPIEGSGPSVEFITPTVGTHTVSVTVKDQNGKTATDSLTVTVAAAQDAPAAQGNKMTNMECTANYVDGVELFNRGNFTRAMAPFNKVIESCGPDSVAGAMYYRGAIKEKSGDIDGAKADYSSVLRSGPNPQAQEALDRLNKGPGTSSAENRMTIQECSEEFSRGHELYRKADYAGATELFNKVIKSCDPFHPAVDRAYAYRGLVKERTGDIEGARAEYNAAVKRNGNSLATQALEQLNNKPPATTVTASTNAPPPNPPDAQQQCNAETSRGGDAYNAKDYQGAIAAWNRATQYCSSPCFLYNNIGLAKQMQKDWNGAKQSFEAALRCNPNESSYRKNFDNVNQYITQINQKQQCDAEAGRGGDAYNARDFQGAIASWNRAVQYCSSPCFLYNNIGLAKQQLGDLAGAKQSMEAAVRCNPNDSDFRSNLNGVNAVIAQQNQPPPVNNNPPPQNRDEVQVWEQTSDNCVGSRYTYWRRNGVVYDVRGDYSCRSGHNGVWTVRNISMLNTNTTRYELVGQSGSIIGVIGWHDTYLGEDGYGEIKGVDTQGNRATSSIRRIR